MILVVGCGFVGETVAKSLEENDTKVIRIDPNTMTTKSQTIPMLKMSSCSSNPVDGKCDDSIIRTVLKELGDRRILLKCTVASTVVKI